METKNLVVLSIVLLSVLLVTSFIRSDTAQLIGQATNTVPGATNRLTGTLSVSSEPAGAVVYVDNVYVGLTPLQKNISAGTHTLKLEKDGYQIYQAPVTIVPTHTTIRAIKIEKNALGCNNYCKIGEVMCYNPLYRRECGNYDDDLCTEWSGAIACPDYVCYMPSCEDGLCSLIYVPAGQTDAGCSGEVGCTDLDCSCDGMGSCI